MNVTFSLPTPEIAGLFRLDHVDLAALRLLVAQTPDWPGESLVEFKLPLSMQTDEEEYTRTVKVQVHRASGPELEVRPMVIHRREELAAFHPGTILRAGHDGIIYKTVNGTGRLIVLYAGHYTSMNTDDVLKAAPQGLQVLWAAAPAPTEGDQP